MNETKENNTAFSVAAGMESWLKKNNATCANIKLSKASNVDITAQFDSQKSLSDIMSIMQERPDVTVQSVINTQDGRLVHMSSTQLPDNGRELFKIEWDNKIREKAPSLILIAVALLLMQVASVCNNLTNIDRSLTKIADFPHKEVNSISANIPSLTDATKAKPIDYSVLPQIQRETMPLPSELKMEHRNDSTSTLSVTSNNGYETTKNTSSTKEEALNEELQQEEIMQTELPTAITIPAMDNDVLIVPPDILRPLNNIVDSKDDTNQKK